MIRFFEPIDDLEPLLPELKRRPEDAALLAATAQRFEGAVDPAERAIAELIRLRLAASGRTLTADEEERAEDLDLEIHLACDEASPPGVTAHDFRFGLPSWLAIDLRQAAPADVRLALRHPIRRLTLFNCEAAYVELLRDGLSNVRQLDAEECPLGDAGLADLARMKELEGVEVLNLADTGLSARGLEALCSSPVAAGLRELNLNENLVGAPGARVLANSSLPSTLAGLEIGACDITDSGAEALARPGWPSLTRLLAGYNDLREAGVLALSEPTWAPKLEELGFSGTPLDRRCVLQLATPERLGRLRELSLGNCDLGDGGVEQIFFGSGLRKLDWLFLGRNDLGKRAIHALASALTSLAGLSIVDNAIGDEGFDALLRASFFTTLVKLDAERTAIGDVGIERLAAVHGCSLEELTLDGNDISDAGARRLLDWPYLPSLRTLTLDDNACSPRLARLIEARRRGKNVASLRGHR